MSDSEKQPLPELPETPNLELWKKVCQTDPRFTKPVDQRGGYTAINAQYQLMNATAQWGPYGKDWGLRKLDWTVTQLPDIGTNLALDSEFFYPEEDGEVAFPISVDMPFKNNDDCRKKLLTEARSKSLSCLGFNADIFLGRWDDNRYVSEMSTKFGEQDSLRNLALAKIKTAKDAKKLKECENRANALVADDVIDATIFAELEAAIKERRKQIEKPTKSQGKDLTDQEVDQQLDEQFQLDSK